MPLQTQAPVPSAPPPPTKPATRLHWQIVTRIWGRNMLAWVF